MARRAVRPHTGIVCTGETYRGDAKTAFSRGRRSPSRPGSSTPAFTGNYDGANAGSTHDVIEALDHD